MHSLSSKKTPCSTSLADLIIFVWNVQDMSNNWNEDSGNGAQGLSLYSGMLCKPLGAAALGNIPSIVLILERKSICWLCTDLHFTGCSLLHACFLRSILTATCNHTPVIVSCLCLRDSRTGRLPRGTLRVCSWPLPNASPVTCRITHDLHDGGYKPSLCRRLRFSTSPVLLFSAGFDYCSSFGVLSLFAGFAEEACTLSVV